MIDAGILEGDIIVVDRGRRPIKGDVVVALVDNEATVKSFYPQNSRIELRPANALMEPLRYPADKVSILGVVVSLQRSLG
jgi:repressor LexA